MRIHTISLRVYTAISASSDPFENIVHITVKSGDHLRPSCEAAAEHIVAVCRGAIWESVAWEAANGNPFEPLSVRIDLETITGTEQRYSLQIGDELENWIWTPAVSVSVYNACEHMKRELSAVLSEYARRAFDDRDDARGFSWRKLRP